MQKAVLALCLATGLALGQANQEDNFSLADLMNIKLQTGSFLELDLTKSALSMTVIDRDKLRLSGARHLTEALEVYVPGFQYMYNKWNGVLWGMRGVATDRNTKFIVLVNGHKMNTEARDGFFQETTIGMLGDVQRIEVLRGPAGLVYGTGAIAGIVNIVTRSVEKEGFEVSGKMGAWSFEDRTREWQGLAFLHPASGQDLVASLGYQSADGVGMNRSRIWGMGSWPYNSGSLSQQGAASDGSMFEKDGDWKTSLDWKGEHFRLYARATHQVDNAGGMFPYDPWPEISGTPDSTAAAKNFKGKSITWNDPFWSGTESYGNSRRDYIADNVMVDGTYELPIQDDLLKLHAGFDGNTNRIAIAYRRGYEADLTSTPQDAVEETFGERRYTGGFTYLLKRIPKLQLAMGYEFRYDDIGDDLDGKNIKAGNINKKVVSEIQYTNHALYSEGFYDLNEKVGISAGLRWDGHTRTIDDGGILSPKLALVLNPTKGHTIKLIGQSSANNGSADNYEYNRWHFNEVGDHPTSLFYERPYVRPADTTAAKTVIVPAPTQAQLHSLKPERTTSFELATAHQFGAVSVMPSFSYNMVTDLMAWNQDYFRVVNVGEYNYINLDLDVEYKTKVLTVGANHTWQRPVNTDPMKWHTTLSAPAQARNADGTPKFDSSIVGGRTYYYPVEDPTATTSKTIYPVYDQVTKDGKTFLNLASHVTKVYGDWKALEWLTLHGDARIFWGLDGRDSLYAADEAKGWDYLNITRDAMVKLDLSCQMALPRDFILTLYAYDLLGSETGSLATNSARWQQMATPDQKDVYGTDFRSFALKVDKSF